MLQKSNSLVLNAKQLGIIVVGLEGTLMAIYSNPSMNAGCAIAILSQTNPSGRDCADSLTSLLHCPSVRTTWKMFRYLI